MPDFFTIGHSDRSLAEFLELLAESEIDVVIDVRRLPGSRKYPWFDHEALAASLAECGVAYKHETALTGRRSKQPEVAEETNAFWTNRSFHNYADYALSEEFQAGLSRLRATECARPVVMCSEAVWWRCHRRLIADHLLAHGETVLHIMGPGQVKPAELTVGAVVGDNARVTYPAKDQG